MVRSWEHAQLVAVDGTTRSVRSPEAVRLVAAVLDAHERGEQPAVFTRQHVLTTTEAADLLAISRPTLYKLCASGQLPFHMAGRDRRFLAGHVHALLQVRSAHLSKSSAYRRCLVALSDVSLDEDVLNDPQYVPSSRAREAATEITDRLLAGLT
ncbi:helix-turn-helix domain-containing protein [Euzebya sp.]|uniref:helix-turn-helix domain-containing protein n=1 Tax=Euzebya sp. TaxID=1971409 RepID=UPI003519CC3B